jgi:hypothetical protein
MRLNIASNPKMTTTDNITIEPERGNSLALLQQLRTKRQAELYDDFVGELLPRLARNQARRRTLIRVQRHRVRIPGVRVECNL